MLRACQQVLRPGGRMAFYTIFAAAGLSEPEFRRARRAGPSALSTRRRQHADMLRCAGFTGVEETDVTPGFLATTIAWYEGRQRLASELAAAEGEASFRERQHDLQLQLKAIEAGLLRRSLFIAAVPAT